MHPTVGGVMAGACVLWYNRVGGFVFGVGLAMSHFLL